MTPLDVTASTTGTRTTIRLAGELDHYSAPQLDAAVRAAEQNLAATIILDLRDVAFCDSNGVRVLVQADNRARRHGHRLLVIPATGLLRVLKMTRLDDKLTLVDPTAVD